MFNRYANLVITHLRNLKRDRGALFGIILFPLIFIGVFGVAFQTSDPANSTYTIGIINNDVGIPGTAIVPMANGSFATGDYFSSLYLSKLNNLTMMNDANESISVFNAKSYNQTDTAMKAIEDRSIYALVILPENFSLAMMSALRTTFQAAPQMAITTNNYASYASANFTTNIKVIGDQTLQTFSIVASVLTEYTRQFSNLGAATEGVAVAVEGNIKSEGLSTFDYILPGLVIFGILQNLGIISSSLYRDVEKGVLQRLRHSRMRSSEYVLSMVTTQAIIAMVQIPIFFTAGAMFGFPVNESVVPAFFIGFLLSLSITGMGLIIAAFASSESSVNSLSGLIATPVAFLAGAFFVVPNPVIIGAGGILPEGASIRALDFLTASPALRALRGILLAHKSIGDYWLDIAMLGIMTVIYLVLGLVLYSKKHLSAK